MAQWPLVSHLQRQLRKFFPILRQRRDVFAVRRTSHLVPFEWLLWKPIVVLWQRLRGLRMLRGLLASKIRSPVRKLRQTQVQHCDEGAQGCDHHVLQRRRETKVGMFISPMPGELNTSMKTVLLSGLILRLVPSAPPQCGCSFTSMPFLASGQLGRYGDRDTVRCGLLTRLHTKERQDWPNAAS